MVPAHFLKGFSPPRTSFGQGIARKPQPRRGPGEDEAPQGATLEPSPLSNANGWWSGVLFPRPPATRRAAPGGPPAALCSVFAVQGATLALGEASAVARVRLTAGAVGVLDVVSLLPSLVLLTIGFVYWLRFFY